MSRGDVLGRLVCLRLFTDTDAFLFLAVRSVALKGLVADADAFLFLPVRLVDRLVLLDRVLARPCAVWANLCTRCAAFVFAVLTPSRARAFAACLTFLLARTSLTKFCSAVQSNVSKSFSTTFHQGHDGSCDTAKQTA